METQQLENEKKFDLADVFPSVLRTLYDITQDIDAPHTSRVGAGRVLVQYQVVKGDHIKLDKDNLKLLQTSLLGDGKKKPPVMGELPHEACAVEG